MWSQGGDRALSTTTSLSLSTFFFIFFTPFKVAMTGDKVAISRRAAQQGQQKMNQRRSIQYSVPRTCFLHLNTLSGGELKHGHDHWLKLNMQTHTCWVSIH